MTRIISVLDLATSHLPEMLMVGPMTRPPKAGERIGPLDSIEGVIAYPHGEYGYLLWVPNDPQDHALVYGDDATIPPEVLAVQVYARSLDCDYVLFDRDADVNDALPTWEW